MKRKKLSRYFAFFMILNLLIEIVSPTVAFALTSGSSQPEFSGFEPANSSEMVDLFTGDFKYNIPLMDIDGYPLNISYHAGQNMESEASWVGLGWSLNPGALNRMVKGLPDDFKGDEVKSSTRIKPQASMGIGMQFATWIGASIDPLNMGVGPDIGLGADAGLMLTYNNYKGYGIELQMDGHGSLSLHTPIGGKSLSGGIGMTLSSQDGGTLSYQHAKGFQLLNYSQSMGEGTSINTRSGAMSKTYFSSNSVSGVVVGVSTSQTLPAGSISYSPRIGNDFECNGFGLSVKGGFWGCGTIPIPPPIKLTGGIMIGYKGFYNLSKLASSTKNSPAYGYMYSESANDNSLMDFNRFRDGVIAKETPNGPMASMTYDIFSASAQGMGCNFRSFRSDIGTVHDNIGTVKSINTPIGTELGIGVYSHFVLDIMTIMNDGKSGNWNTILSHNANFTNPDISKSENRFFEKNYFKQMGEMTARNSTFDNDIGGENVISPELKKMGFGYEATSTFPGTSATDSTIARNARDIRNTNIYYLTAEKAHKIAHEKRIFFYDKSTLFINGSYMVDTSGSVSRVAQKSFGGNNYNINHHISEMTLTNNNGSRYVYGIPVYNLHKKRVMFNASNRKESAYNPSGYPGTTYSSAPLNKSHGYQMLEYESSDLSSNLRGQDNFYQADETPPFSTSCLLTCILSPDYVDVTDNGPSYDDLGSFTKFNYSKADNYKWRDPYRVPSSATYTESLVKQKEHANFDSGLLSDEFDDKAFYEYGVRENYYVHSIETKNYVAYFELGEDPREDAMDVDGEDGNVTTATCKKSYHLKSIKLYSKAELYNHGISVDDAIPIKTVNFEYDYSLCPGTFNSNASDTKGKLTLKKLYFTYGASQKAALSPYLFTYADNNHDGSPDANFTYHPRSVDRWGNYKPNSGNASGNAGTLNNIEFPYAEQNKTNADSYAAAWNLTEIQTPTGSSIKITYEADDYGYIQNKQPGQMLMVKDYVESIDAANDNVSSSYTGNTNIFKANYMIVDLSKINKGIPVSMSASDANEFANSNLFNKDEEMYYRCFVKLAGPENTPGLKTSYWDFISGYGNIEEVGLFTNTSHSGNKYTDNSGNDCYRYAYVRLKKEIAFDSKEINPLTFAAWEFMRTYLPRVAYPGSEPANMGDQSHKPTKQLANAIKGLGVAMADFINGVSGKPNKRFFNQKFCKQIDYGKSFVRAYVPYHTKMGGGHRVKQIISTDGWNRMTYSLDSDKEENGSVYGQTYDYRTTEKRDTLSSGVAMYEPLTGGDENSLHQPVPFEIEKKMAPNDHFYQELPLGEMLYPAAFVGYSKVTVKNIDHAYNDGEDKVCRIGKTEYEFYTAKDFPIIEDRSALTKNLFENDLVDEYTVVKSAYKIFHATQGYVLKFNDMHGKFKAVTAYGEDNITTPVSGTKYFYKQKPGPGGSKELVTLARTINENKTITGEVIARDIDVTIDTRENLNVSTTLGNQMLIEASLCFPGFSMFDNVIYSDQTFGVRTAVVTKIVQQYGILERTETFDNKSKTVTDNLLWDRNTGEVVVTKVTNNFNQPVYTCNYPAYWMYPKLDNEFKRQGVTLFCPSASSLSVWNAKSGVIKITAVNSPVLLLPGDEVSVLDANHVMIANSLSRDKFWVTQDNSTSGSDYNLKLIDREGNTLNIASATALDTTHSYYIRVDRPANRNQMALSAGQVSLLNNPLSGGGFNPTGNIISSSATEYCETWNLYTQTGSSEQESSCFPPGVMAANFYNPYTSGFMGNWRVFKSHTYKTNRSYSNTQPNVKADGVFNSYTPFWQYNSTDDIWEKSNDNRWMLVNMSTAWSPFGYLMESKDAIGIFHAQRHGFNHTLPILKATNARLRHTGFESFEDFPLIYSVLNSIHPCNLYGTDQLGFYKGMAGGGKPTLIKATGNDAGKAHTGLYALRFGGSQSITLTHDVEKPNANMPLIEVITKCYDGDNHELEKLNFSPEKKYIASFWIKGDAPSADYSALCDFDIEVDNTQLSTTQLKLVNKTGIINGWQKLDYEFYIPSYSNKPIEFIISNAGVDTFYFDDFRVQPFNASMVCNVYDPFQLRLWAQLDDRNFATIMEYDNQGLLVRKKKETEKGIYTLQETRKATVKDYVSNP